MNLLKTLATAAMLTVGALAGVNAVAANATPAANGAQAKCEHQAQEKKLTGQAAQDFVKKCISEAKPKK